MIQAEVYFVSSQQAMLVNFILDTGASRTLIPEDMASDAGYQLDKRSTFIESTGTGGNVKIAVEQAVILFHDESHSFAYALNIGILKSNDQNKGFPPLLGRDILTQWEVSFNHARKKCLCTPGSYSERFDKAPLNRPPVFSEIASRFFAPQ